MSPLLNDADALFVGESEVDAVYLGEDQVWPPAGGSYTVYAVQATGDQISASATSYAAARAGDTLSPAPDSAPTVGQILTPAVDENPEVWECFEGYLSFDTSGVVGTITSATLSLGLSADLTTTDFTLEARSFDWGVAITEADWVAGASLGALTLLATLPSAGIGAAGYKAMTESGSALQAAINQSGHTRIILCSDRHRLGTTPPDSELLQFDKWNDTFRPKLDIVTS